MGDKMFWILLTFIGTMVGNLTVWIPLNHNSKQELIAFSTGSLLATSIQTMLLPAMEHVNQLEVGASFLLGILLVQKIDKMSQQGASAVAISMLLHNLIEGLTVGTCYRGTLNHSLEYQTYRSLAIGMSSQNIGDGIGITVAIQEKEEEKKKVFLKATGIALVEVLGIAIGMILKSIGGDFLYMGLSLTSAISLYGVVKEFLPILEEQKINQVLFYFIFFMIGDTILP